MDDEEVLEAARAVRPHLRGPISSRTTTDSEISQLDQAEAGEAVKLQVLQVLSRSEETRAWAGRLPAHPPGERGYEGLPGRSSSFAFPGMPAASATAAYGSALPTRYPCARNTASRMTG